MVRILAKVYLQVPAFHLVKKFSSPYLEKYYLVSICTLSKQSAQLQI